MELLVSKINTLEYLNLKYMTGRCWSNYRKQLLKPRSKTKVKLFLTRMIGAEVNYVRLGYRVRPAPPGYKNIKVETPHGIRTILDPQDI